MKNIICLAAVALVAGCSLPKATSKAPLKVRVIAHRGLHGPGVAQNSLAAFKAAYAAGAKWIETDFHLLNNGRILCVHDRRELKKVSGEDRVIAELTEADVESIDIGKTAGTVSPVHMPYLEDVLDIVPKDAIAQCEIKLYGSNYADKFDAARRSAGLSETNILVTSSNVDWLADFHRRYPRYQTGWLGCEVGEKDFDLQKSIARAREASCSFFCPGASSALRSGLTPDDADRVRASGLDFRLFGVNTPELLTYAAKMRATAFTCDHWYKSFEWAKTMPYVRLLP